MYTADLVAYLEDLRAHNNKAWFESNRKRYDALRQQFVALVATVIDESPKFDPPLAGLSAPNTLFRINRDIRFSRDKSPYKATFSAALSPGKKDTTRPGYYLCITADDELILGAGLHQPPAPELARLRQAIAADGQTLAAILNEPAFKRTFGGLDDEDKLKTMPRDYPPDHPFADYLRYKSFTVGNCEPASAISDDSLASHIAGVFKEAYPLVSFLRDILG